MKKSDKKILLGMKDNKYYVSWQHVFDALQPIDKPENVVYGIPNGGMIASSFLKYAKTTHLIEDANIILDDLIDSGATMKIYLDKYPEKQRCVLLNKYKLGINKWVVFPWEVDHPKGEMTVESNVTRILQYLGEDTSRDGLKETPTRVVNSWKELYAGYLQDPKSVFKVFEAEKYDEMVILKNIEMYSTCEHHMLPFSGKAHIAYIPNGKVIGVSKLARLLDIFARRLQIQEKICDQVSEALQEYLSPLGAACIIECKHMCMSCRGVNKQHSVMVTSSLTGKFRTEPVVRSELMSLINLS